MSANLIVGKDPTGNKVPVAVDAAGKLQIGGVSLDSLTVNTDQIEGKQDVTNALLTATAADLAAVKTQLASGTIAVTGGGGGGGGASAAYNATLPTYTSGASTTLQTDVNGRLITTGPELQTISTEAQAIDAKLPALSSGRVPVEANNAASQVYNFSQSGAIAANTVLIGPIESSQFREVSVHVVSIGTGGTAPIFQVSNDNSNWVIANGITSGGAIGNTLTNTNATNVPLLGARFFRIVSQGNQTSGTTTLVAYASQQATPKLYQQVSGTVAASSVGFISTNASSGYNTFHSLVSAASTNATSVKSSAGTLGTILLSNTSASWRYVKFFNLSVAPTPGTSTPVWQAPIPPNSSIDITSTVQGFRLSTGIAYAITGGSALLDNTSVGSGEVLVNLSYV